MGAFDFATAKHLAEESGCYVLTNAADEVIYIGQAVSLRSRVLQHLTNGRQRELTVLGRASLLSVLYIKKPMTLNAHERGWLNQVALADGVFPPLNRAPGHL